MNERDKSLLLDMLDTAKRAQTFVSGKTRQDLEADNALLGFAVVRAVEIIGEAASKISQETREAHPMIAWRNIIGMQNRIVHDYNNVDYDILWQVVTVNIPELIPQLEAILHDSTKAE
jgi:uncharacterized protein with HEPN domain